MISYHLFQRETTWDSKFKLQRKGLQKEDTYRIMFTCSHAGYMLFLRFKFGNVNPGIYVCHVSSF